MIIVHLGISGYPGGNASLQRIRYTFKAIQETGLQSWIINKHSIHAKPYAAAEVHEDGMKVISTSPLLFKPESFLKRNINKLKGSLAELKLLFKHRKQIKAAILYTPYFNELLYYRLLSRICGFKLIIQYVEFRSQIAERSSLGTKINDRLFDQQGFRLCDGVIPISDYLQAHIAQRSNNKMPQLKIPAICDFTEFNQYATAPEKNYLMYCGTVHYLEVIYFNLEFFKKIKEQNIYNGKIILVVSGDVQTYWNEFKAYLASFPFKTDVEVRSKIPYSELVGLYKGADLLLIPLRNNIQDIARFPQKISEYTASKRPFISTNVGEMTAYFQHLNNAILANEYSTDSYVAAFKDAVEKNLLNSIGEAGFKTGMQHFHYQSNCSRLTQFINLLN